MSMLVIKGTSLEYGDGLSVTMNDGKCFSGEFVCYLPRDFYEEGNEETIKIREDYFCRSLSLSRVKRIECHQ